MARHMTSVAVLLIASATPITSAHAVEYRFYHPDPLGSNTVVTDRSGNVVQRAVYSPYGELTSVVDGQGNSIEPGADSVRHLFTGQEQDPESGLHSFGARHYDPFVGRFLSVDPGFPQGQGSLAQLGTHGAALNGYAYTLNQPTKLIDPTGEIAVLAAIGIAATIAGVALTAYEYHESGLATDLAAVAQNPSKDNFRALALSQLEDASALGIVFGMAEKALPSTKLAGLGNKLLKDGPEAAVWISRKIARLNLDDAGAALRKFMKKLAPREVKNAEKFTDIIANQGTGILGGHLKPTKRQPHILQLTSGHDSRLLFYIGIEDGRKNYVLVDGVTKADQLKNRYDNVLDAAEAERKLFQQK